MHDMMHDARDLSGSSRATIELRCDPLLRISLQALPTNPNMHSLWISFSRTADLLWFSQTADPCMLNGKRFTYLNLVASETDRLHGMALQRAKKPRYYGPYSWTFAAARPCLLRLYSGAQHHSGVAAKPRLASCAMRAGCKKARGKQALKYWGCNWNHGFKTAGKPPATNGRVLELLTQRCERRSRGSLLKANIKFNQISTSPSMLATFYF